MREKNKNIAFIKMSKATKNNSSVKYLIQVDIFFFYYYFEENINAREKLIWLPFGMNEINL